MFDSFKSWIPAWFDYPVAFVSISFVGWIYAGKECENAFLRSIVNKFTLYIEGITFMVLSRDTSGIGKNKKNYDPALINITNNKTQIRRIVFIRHGESDWNLIFNKGKDISMLFRLLQAMWKGKLSCIV